MILLTEPHVGEDNWGKPEQACLLACLQPYIEINITKIELSGWSLKARVECRLPGVETTEVKVHMATYSLFATDYRRLVAHRQYKFRSRWWLRSLQVRAMLKRNFRNPAHDLSVKHSSCICSYTDSSCPGCWLRWYLDICLWVTNPALCNDKLLKSVCSSLRLAPRW